MSASRPYTCLFCTVARSTVRQTRPTRRKFHSSPLQLNRKPKHPNLKAEELQEYVSVSKPKAWSQDDKVNLNKIYSPEQIAAIEAAETSINRKELTGRTVRRDPWSLDYYDELASIDPVVDKPVRQPFANLDPNSRLKTPDEISEDVARFIQNFPLDEKEQEGAWADFEKHHRLTVGREQHEKFPRTAAAPDIGSLSPKEPSKKMVRKSADGQQKEEEEPTPALVRLMQMTGYDRRQIANLRVKSLITHRVVNQTRLGKISKMYFLSVAGNGQGLIGIGEGKAEEAPEARLQSQYRAIRNMQPILRYENRTIFGDVKGKVSATELELYARPPGFGLRCQQYIWEICKCAGISDLAGRVTRSRNPMNTVKATVAALLSQKDPEDIARARGKKLVDVRKVYYAGLAG